MLVIEFSLLFVTKTFISFAYFLKFLCGPFFLVLVWVVFLCSLKMMRTISQQVLYLVVRFLYLRLGCINSNSKFVIKICFFHTFRHVKLLKRNTTEYGQRFLLSFLRNLDLGKSRVLLTQDEGFVF